MKSCGNCGNTNSIDYKQLRNDKIYECLVCGEEWFVVENQRSILKEGLKVLCESEINIDVYPV